MNPINKKEKEAREAIKLLEKIEQEEKEYKEERAKKKKAREEEKARRTRKKKDISTGVLVGVCGSLLASAIAVEAKLYHGASNLAVKYSEDVMYDVGYSNFADGYHFNIGSNMVDYEDAVAILRKRSEEQGYTDAETYIALNHIFGHAVAKDVIPEKPSRKEKVETILLNNFEIVNKEESSRGK